LPCSAELWAAVFKDRSATPGVTLSNTGSNGGLSLFSSASRFGQIDPTNLSSLNYGNADYDVRHNVTADFIWENPIKFRNRVMDDILHGWSWAAE
jgi:hypothetical protein